MHSPFPFIFLISTIPCLPLSVCIIHCHHVLLKCLFMISFTASLTVSFHCLFLLSTSILLFSVFKHHSNERLCLCCMSVRVQLYRNRLILLAWLQAAVTKWDGTAQCQPSWPHPRDHHQPINTLINRWERQSERTAPQVNMKRQREKHRDKQQEIVY